MKPVLMFLFSIVLYHYNLVGKNKHLPVYLNIYLLTCYYLRITGLENYYIHRKYILIYLYAINVYIISVT